MNKRPGTTQVELIIATLLLVTVLATITAFRKQTVLSAQIGQHASFAQSQLVNMRREIGTWPFDEITSETIAARPGDESNFLPDARWIAEVAEIDQPIQGKRIVLSLHWQESDRQQASPRLTFWMRRQP